MIQDEIRDVDTWQAVSETLAAALDSQQWVVTGSEAVMDSHQRVVGMVAPGAVSRQTVFAVLIHESHPIQV